MQGSPPLEPPPPTLRGPEPVRFRGTGGVLSTRGFSLPQVGLEIHVFSPETVPALPGPPAGFPRARVPSGVGGARGSLLYPWGRGWFWAHSALSGPVLRGGKFLSPLRCFPSSVLGYLTV